jgi:hypothetical protein
MYTDGLIINYSKKKKKNKKKTIIIIIGVTKDYSTMYEILLRATRSMLRFINNAETQIQKRSTPHHRLDDNLDCEPYQHNGNNSTIS